MNTNTKATAQAKANTTTATTFETVKRNYETALAQGKDTTQELTALATAVAYSVINKCIDPQRKTATQWDTASNNGYNPAMVTMKRGIATDLATLDNTRRTANAATATTYNADGDLITVTADKDAAAALVGLIDTTLSDGIDLVQTAALAILEQAAEHANGGEWLDTPYTCPAVSISAPTKAPHTGTITPRPYKRFIEPFGKPSRTPAPYRQTPAVGIAT